MSGSEEKKINKLKLRKMLYTKKCQHQSSMLMFLFFWSFEKKSIKFDFAQKMTIVINGKVGIGLCGEVEQ